MEVLDLIKATLIEEGYSGLFCAGECACESDDLAPCGECNQEDDERYINGCAPGYKFSDPEIDHFWIIKSSNVEPTAEEWESARREYL